MAEGQGRGELVCEGCAEHLSESFRAGYRAAVRHLFNTAAVSTEQALAILDALTPGDRELLALDQSRQTA